MSIKKNIDKANIFKKLIREHSSFLVIALGSLAFFVANIYAKEFFSDDDFNVWIYTVSLISFFSTFAMMGQDQLLLRFSNNQKSSMIIDTSTLSVIFGALIIFVPFSLMLFSKNIMGIKPVELVSLIVSFSFCKLGYQLARIQKHFLLAQLSLNGWKLILLPIITFVASFGVVNLFLLSFIGGVFIFFNFLSTAKINVIENTETICKYGIGYFSSMGAMAIFVYFERFVIEGKISLEEYGDYLYFLTISLSIFSIFASYFGFKEAIKYKEYFDLKMLKRDLIGVSSLVVPLSIIWMLLIYLFAPILNIDVNSKLFVLVSVIGVLKCLYALLSSAMLVKMSYGDIIKINLNTIMIFIFLYFFTIEFVTDIYLLLIMLALLWFVRSIMIFSSIKTNVKID